MPDLPSIKSFTPLRSAMRCCAEMMEGSSRGLLQFIGDGGIPEDLVAAVAVARVRHGLGPCFTSLGQFPFVTVVPELQASRCQHLVRSLAERLSSLPSWVALSAQIGSLADGSARRSTSVVMPVFS